MGMRQNIAMQYSDNKTIYIYSHYDGEEGLSPLKYKLKCALQRRQRWNDESYLARIIFSEVIREDINGATGYGIAPYETDPEYPTIKVDFKNNTVDGMPFEQFIKQ